MTELLDKYARVDYVTRLMGVCSLMEIFLARYALSYRTHDEIA